MTRRSSLFTRSKMLRYVKTFSYFTYATLIIGTGVMAKIKYDEEKSKKQEFINQYMKQDDQSPTSTPQQQNESPVTSTSPTTPSSPSNN
eukprot:gene2764-3438_t